MQSRFDPRRLLKFSGLYSSFTRFVGGNARENFVRDFLKPRPGDRILDIGCGPADILAYLPTDVEYVGFDLSPKYIETARNRFGERGRFECQRVSASNVDQFGEFDLVLAQGIVHHLNDEEATHLFELARAAMKEHGRLVTLDGCFVDDQSSIERQLLKLDRGEHVRNLQDYQRLAGSTFPNVATHIRHDLLRIPYTHIIMECTRRAVAQAA